MAKNLILDKLEGVNQRFDEIQQQVADPEIVSDMKVYIKLSKENRADRKSTRLNSSH